MIDKRGETSTIGVTIAIILGIVLIVFLIWGFSSNWVMFSSISEIYTGKVNIDSAKQACEIACDNNQMVQFCDIKKSVTYMEKNKLKKGSYSCGELAVVLGDDDFKCDSLCRFSDVGKCEGDAYLNCGAISSEQGCVLVEGCSWVIKIEKVL